MVKQSARSFSGSQKINSNMPRKSTGVDGSAEIAESETFLDQSEVLKSMMALQRTAKGKERESSPSGSSNSLGDSSDDEDTASTSSDGGEGDKGQDGGQSEDGGKVNLGDDSEFLDGESEAESSSAASNRAASRRNGTILPVQAKKELSRIRTSVAGGSEANGTTAISSPFSTTVPKATTFESLGLSRPLISALNGISIRKPTDIQSACIPPILRGQDCIGGAKTGSGKTLAFALPIVERIARDPYGIWAVVLTPTRELAYQLAEQFIAVGKPLGLSTITVVGGMDMMTQAAELDARPHIVVATPGRLCDLLRSNSASGNKLARVKVLVLDEADRLLTPTFAPDLGYLFCQAPTNRQTCLFTATISDAIMQLAQKPPQPGKQRPFVFRVESDQKTVANLKQKYLFIPSQIRDPYLIYLLNHPPSDIDTVLRSKSSKRSSSDKATTGSRRKRQRSESDSEDEDAPHIPSTIIFAQRCATAHLLHLLLEQLDIPSVPLHSHLTQPQRLESLARFRGQQVPILVTTDVGSRGLDIPQVAMVINWDCPRRSDDYIHRVGRTARAGKGGVAVTVVTEKDVDLVQMIEEEVGVTMAELDLPEEEVLEGLNAVSVARRMATMEMHDTGFGERQATNMAKALRRLKRNKAT